MCFGLSIPLSAYQVDDSSIQEAKQGVAEVEIISLAVLIGSIMVGVLGIGLIATGTAAAYVGIPLVVISLPAMYASYNIYKVCRNMLDILTKNKDYIANGTVDSDKMKEKLAQGTVCFEWAIDRVFQS